MLSDRLAISALLIPLAMWVIASGGTLYLATILLIFLLAALEYANIFKMAGLRPARPLIVGGVLALIAAQQLAFLNPRGLLLPLALLLALTWHLFDYEFGATTSGTDFTVTVGGLVYLGVMGSYFIALRALPDGQWWIIAVFSGMWLADSGAYAFGRAFGKHKMSPRLSPKKTWEGYAGSVIWGAAGGGLLAFFWHFGADAGSLLTWQTGVILGALVGMLGPLGDLGISMMKRQVGLKDTGNLMAGHGGALDRMDSWLVAIPVGYYFVLLLQALTR
jgi:phosphatidate cytidylyltransferase